MPVADVLCGPFQYITSDLILSVQLLAIPVHYHMLILLQCNLLASTQTKGLVLHSMQYVFDSSLTFVVGL